MVVRCEGPSEDEVARIVEHASSHCTVAKSVTAGFPVAIRRET
jgi:uncharacterized OsmC-like protein